MSIINDQNILGDPTLALSARVGMGVGSAADYSFANQANMWEKNLYEAIGEARGGTWMQPISYAGEVAQAEVEKEPVEPEVGVAGLPTQSVADPTKYGPEWKGDMAENDAAVATTKLTQVAAVIAKKVDAVESIVDATDSAVRSATITEQGIQGPVASGGAQNGYKHTNPYYISTVAFQGNGATTTPEPIDITNWQGDMAGNDAVKASLGDNAPANDGVGGGYTQGPSTKTVHNAKVVGAYTQGASTKTASTYDQASLGGNGPQESSNGNPGGWGGH